MSTPPAPITVLALAVALDLLVGDPPNRWHPVAWIGGLIARGRRLAPRAPEDLALYGTFLIVVMAGLAAGGALAAHAALAALPTPVALLGRAWLLKCSLALDGLFAAVDIVRGHLVAGDLAGARRQVAWHLVSRPADDLDAPAVASAAVESLAENLTDGLVAPVCFYVAGALLGGVGAGLALAWAYRAVNTADAMIGYRRDELLHLGHATARTDDALNYGPARMAAVTIVAGAWLARQSSAGAARVWRRDGARTESPNAGQTMAAMAGALGVTLEKRGHYRLGDGPPPDLDAIDRAVRVARWAAALGLVGAGLALLLER
jgi:adenosylcobinamide-phosphate synthase